MNVAGFAGVAATRVARAWWFVRALAGDDAYERYLDHRARCHAGGETLSRQAFYLAEQQRRWSGVQRCC